MAVYNPYCTTEDVQLHIKNNDIAPSLVENSISEASRYVEEYTGRFFHKYDYTTDGYQVPALDFIEGKHIYLPFPVISVTELFIDGNLITSDVYDFPQKPVKYNHRSVIEITVEKTSDFLGQVSQIKTSNALVKGIFGFTATSSVDIPDDIQFPSGIRRATTLIASTFTENNRKEQVTLDGSRTSLATFTIPDEAHSILNMHKRNVVVC